MKELQGYKNVNTRGRRQWSGRLGLLDVSHLPTPEPQRGNPWDSYLSLEGCEPPDVGFQLVSVHLQPGQLFLFFQEGAVQQFLSLFQVRDGVVALLSGLGDTQDFP